MYKVPYWHRDLHLAGASGTYKAVHTTISCLLPADRIRTNPFASKDMDGGVPAEVLGAYTSLFSTVRFAQSDLSKTLTHKYKQKHAQFQ